MFSRGPPQQQQQQQQQQAPHEDEQAAAAAARAATPSASALSVESDMSHGQQWWLPQPHPSRDESHSEWRPAVPLAEALQCSVCKDLLKEAITAAECSHSYCYDCIDRCITVGGKANFCPVCNVLLGPNPWEHNKLKYDFMLDSIVRKVFPRPKLDEALEARRLEREEATRQAKASLAKKPGRGFARVGSTGQLTGLARAGTAGGAEPLLAPVAGPTIDVAFFPRPASSSAAAGGGQRAASQQLAPLPKPYLRLPAGTTLPVMKAWVIDRLVGKKGDASKMPQLQLHCAGQLLASQGMSMQEVHDAVWQPHCSACKAQGQHVEELMLVYYSPEGS